MTDYKAAIAKARTRIEACVADMDETEAATLLKSVEPAVHRHHTMRLGEATPYVAGTPQDEVYHAAIGPSLDLPLDQQGFYVRQAAMLLTVIAREREDLGEMVDDAVTFTARAIAGGKRLDSRLPMRILRRVRTELVDLLEVETDKAKIAAALASFIGTVCDADINPRRDAVAFIKEVFAEINGPVSRTGAGPIYAALDGRTRSWLSDEIMAA